MSERAEIKKVVYNEGGVQLKTSHDGLCAYVRFLENYPGNLDLRSFLMLLQQQSIRNGLLPDAIKKSLESKDRDTDILIARGTPPVHGINGSVKYTIPPDAIRAAPRLNPDGKVDMKELQVLHNFHTNDVLAELIPHTLGIAGKSVSGEPIEPQPGKPATLTVGKGTMVSPDRTKLVAANDGALVYHEGIICIYPVFTVKEDVDYSVGNLDFVGTIFVKGNVLSGFRVKAEGDISIDGLVEAAQIFAGNEIVIRGGVQGGGRAIIEAGGSIYANFINDAKLRAGEKIETRGSIMRCEVFAADEIVSPSKEGEIVGGKVIAGRKVQVQNLGTALGVTTFIEVGTDPSIVSRLETLQALLAEDQEAFKQIAQTVDKIRTLERRIGRLPSRNQREFEAALNNLNTLRANIELGQNEITRLEQQLEAMKESSVCVLGTVHPGVVIKIGKSTFKVAEAMQAVRFQLQDDRIRISAL
ncbi:MAG TPA: FapA family protein [bacterium]|nr:FapA family protein [bacterium]